MKFKCIHTHVMVVTHLSSLQLLFQCLLIVAQQAAAQHHPAFLTFNSRDQIVYVYII